MKTRYLIILLLFALNGCPKKAEPPEMVALPDRVKSPVTPELTESEQVVDNPSECPCPAGQMCEFDKCIESTLVATEIEFPDQCQDFRGGNDEITFIEILFEFDEFFLTPQAQETLKNYALCLESMPDLRLEIEGHCDERGTQEYNLALGQHRAETVVNYLKLLGIESNRLYAISKGKNQPVCNDDNEACYRQNRRTEFSNKILNRYVYQESHHEPTRH